MQAHGEREIWTILQSDLCVIFVSNWIFSFCVWLIGLKLDFYSFQMD